MVEQHAGAQGDAEEDPISDDDDFYASLPLTQWAAGPVAGKQVG
jgi:hypothetical protein